MRFPNGLDRWKVPPLNTWWNPMPGTLSTQALVLNTLYVWPVDVPPMTLQSISMEVATLGAGSLLRAGFLVVDAPVGSTVITGSYADLGTQDAGTVGAKTWPTTLVWPGGILWCAVVAQTAACSVRGLTNSHGIPLPFATAAETLPTNNAKCSFSLAGVTGGIPASGALVSGNVTQPKIFFRRSAT